MSKVWELFGKTAFWLSWPALWLLFRWSRRTRVLLVCNDEFLVLRGWLGSGGQWGLPGGGLHRGEEPLAGLLREVHEETSIKLDPKQVRSAFQALYKEHGLRFRYEAFVTQLASKPQIKSQPWEIAAWQWQPLKNPTVPLTKDTKTLVDWWLNRP